MLIGDVDKQPAEIRRYTFNYSAWLGSGELITACTITPDDDDIEVVDDSIDIDEGAQKISFLVSGGEDGAQYVLTVRVTTSVGQVKEDELLIRVLELDGA